MTVIADKYRVGFFSTSEALPGCKQRRADPDQPAARLLLPAKRAAPTLAWRGMRCRLIGSIIALAGPMCGRRMPSSAN
jgi:hypothetical protein